MHQIVAALVSVTLFAPPAPVAGGEPASSGSPVEAPASASTEAPAEPGAGTEACVPECRAGYVCVAGACASACNPPCASGEACTDTGECVAAPAPTVVVSAGSCQSDHDCRHPRTCELGQCQIPAGYYERLEQEARPRVLAGAILTPLGAAMLGAGAGVLVAANKREEANFEDDTNKPTDGMFTASYALFAIGFLAFHAGVITLAVGASKQARAKQGRAQVAVEGLTVRF